MAKAGKVRKVVADEAPVVEPKGAAAVAALPDAGAARREELRRRADALAAEAARLETELEAQGIDPERLKPEAVEREVRHAVNDQGEVRVSDAQPGYAYSWIFRDPFNRFGGRTVYAMQALGWEVVKHDMPEAKEHKAVTGERWVADCLLMRCTLDRFIALQLIDRKRRLAQQEGISGALIEKAASRGIRVRDVRTDDKLRALAGVPDDPKVYTRIPTSRELRRQFAKQTAQDILTQRLKDGTAGI